MSWFLTLFQKYKTCKTKVHAPTLLNPPELFQEVARVQMFACHSCNLGFPGSPASCSLLSDETMKLCVCACVRACVRACVIWSKNLILESIKGRNSVANLLKKQRFTILMLILSMMMCIQNLVLFCQFVLKILSKNQIMTSIKGRNSVANLRKTKIYDTDLDLVTDNVYTNFGLILSILSQDTPCYLKE